MATPIRTLSANQDLSVAAMSEEFDFGEGASVLLTVYAHFSVPITEDIEVYYVSGGGSNYDTLIEKKELVNKQDYVFAAEGTFAIHETDKVKVVVTNANTTGIAYVTVKVQKGS